MSFAQATHLGHTEFGKAPERFNAIHVVVPTSELIFMMMNPMMAVTIEDQAIVKPPAVRVDRAISQNLTFNDGPQRVTKFSIKLMDVFLLPRASSAAVRAQIFEQNISKIFLNNHSEMRELN